MNDMTLNEVIFCQFIDSIDSDFKPGMSITVKGRMIGYDDLLEQVKLDQCGIEDPFN